MLEIKTVEKPDERRDFPRGHLEAVHLTGLDFAVATFEPGWRWSESVAPIAGTESCQVHHNGYVVQGRMHIRMDDGGEGEVGPGDAFVCPPGHDAWVVGDEQVLLYDFAGQMATGLRQGEGRLSRSGARGGGGGGVRAPPPSVGRATSRGRACAAPRSRRSPAGSPASRWCRS